MMNRQVRGNGGWNEYLKLIKAADVADDFIEKHYRSHFLHNQRLELDFLKHDMDMLKGRHKHDIDILKIKYGIKEEESGS
jgi:hypothetical protein